MLPRIINRRLSRTLCVLPLIAGLTLTCLAQSGRSGGWESKPVDQWDREDVAFILERSPWSHRIDERKVETSAIGALNTGGSVSFVLRSALILRYAIIRKRQLDEKYDSMSAKEKDEFNKKYASVLKCEECEKYYIVAIAGYSRTLQNVPLVQARKERIFLSNEHGEKRMLAKYAPQKGNLGEALFFFPRYNEKGEPLLTPSNKTLTFHFAYELNDDDRVKSFERVETKVADIVRSDMVIF